MKDTEIERDTILSALTADTHTLEHLQHQNQNTSHHGARQTIETLSHECAILLDELVNNSKKEGLISRVKKIISTLTSVAELLRPHKDTTIEIKNLQKKIKHAHVESEELSAIIQENKMEQKITEQKKSLLREQLDRITREEHALSQKLVIQKTGTKETKITSLTTMGERLKTEYKKYQAEYAKISEQLSTYHFQQHRNKERMLAIQRKSHDINTELSSKEQYVHTILIEQARIEQRSEDIKNEIQQEVPRDIWETIMTPTQEYSLSNEHLTALAEHMITAKKRVNQIGDIEDGIMEEYEEAKQRYDFLSHQSTDLKESHTHLIKIIHELDEKIETQFTHSFKKINEHFNHYFKILFTGGKAALSYRKETKRQKIEERQEDAEETPPNNLQRTIEIDIIACPPNKKITNIGALSGGERSLTSIALLCAIIAANPAPFIVLDEVDAALDEANSERFATILEELSHITQFIAITHNRSTMNKANLLYGVTMNEDASSRLFSVKLEDINEKH
ncbi:MAG: hypothetical protein A3H59_01940 [Candidatus Jacksonbacteria bacterium RIFCSPLOWO2_02_FULL_43_9]|nr:MAG: hypothetical protein A3H59_01940 [Candidatus Jacksonbacteria bacterium RIFCSPLOWO2_02_FULL_43_9]